MSPTFCCRTDSRLSLRPCPTNGTSSVLRYLGIDFVLDATRGPVVLEANARPGLAIQIANRKGLLPGLRRVDAGGLGVGD
ncbi:MAG: hypothetical protein HQ567_00045 [Candidatus Nealsonbacteria bacterium]|nr:hypothetical protein [Candidatus Nealsonbacteria bacterium]